MSLLDETMTRIRAVDPGVVWEVQRRLDGKTKPRKSLGRLEDICCAYAAACDVVPPHSRTRRLW